MSYTRERDCRECGITETVRKDNAADRCKSCAAKESGGKGLLTIKASARTSTCENCGDVYKGSNKRFCSAPCRVAFTPIVERACKTCKTAFTIRESSIKSSNASGNFCSRPCYEKFLCRTERVTGRGSQWKKIRALVLAKFPFCAACGTTKQLQVHHITPFRLTQDNSAANLVPLCVKHHRWVETIFVETEEHGVSEATQFVWNNMIRSMQAATAAKILEVSHATA